MRLEDAAASARRRTRAPISSLLSHDPSTRRHRGAPLDKVAPGQAPIREDAVNASALVRGRTRAPITTRITLCVDALTRRYRDAHRSGRMRWTRAPSPSSRPTLPVGPTCSAGGSRDGARPGEREWTIAPRSRDALTMRYRDAPRPGRMRWTRAPSPSTRPSLPTGPPPSAGGSRGGARPGEQEWTITPRSRGSRELLPTPADPAAVRGDQLGEKEWPLVSLRRIRVSRESDL